MFNYPYIVELLLPKRSADDKTEYHLDRFAERYRRIIDAGMGISIPDNPWDNPGWVHWRAWISEAFQ